MKIVIVNKFFGISGGSEMYSLELMNLLKTRGHEVFFFASNRQPFYEENYVYAKYFPRYVHYSSLSKIELLKNIFRPFYNFEAKSKLDSLIKEVKPDIVHLNSLTSILTPSIMQSCLNNKVPVVMTLHDPYLICPGMDLMYKSRQYCKDLLCVGRNPMPCIYNKCFNNSFRKSFIITAEFLFRKVHKLFDKAELFICPSQSIMDLAVKSGINKNKLTLINNFAPGSFSEIQPEYKNKGYFLYIGRLSKQKGVDCLLKAFETMPEIKLHIVGTGPEESKLKHLARQLGLLNVEFQGFKQGKELDEEYKNCIATILPCIGFETFPTTIMESIFYGKPVIASNIGGIPEIIDNNVNGIIFEPENIEELKSAILKLYNNNDLVQQMGKNGRNKAENMYTQDIYYQKLMRVYNSVLQRSL